MTTVRTVTTVTKETTSGAIGQSPHLDNTLESLLEDLQTSVNTRSPAIQAPPPMVNGVTAYSVEEVTRMIEKDGVRSPEKREYRVHYISPANPTTVISESDIKYKQNLRESDAKLKQDLKESDTKLKQNLSELDNLLVDLRKVQKAGLSAPVAQSGVDSSLLEPVGHTVHPTPRQPAEPIPKRSSSVQKEIIYGTIESGHVRTGRSPSPATPQRTSRRDISNTGGSRYRDKSPTNRRLQRELLESEDFPNIVNSYSFSPSEPLGRRSPSPSQVVTGGKKITTTRTYNYSSNTASPYPDRSYDRKRSPSPTLNYPQSTVHTYSSNVSGSPSQPYPDGFDLKRSASPSPSYSISAPPGSSKVTTVRTYNYTTNTSDTSQPFSGSYEPKQSPSPSPAYPSHTPPGNTKIIHSYNYTTDSNVSKPQDSYPSFEGKYSPSPSPVYPPPPSQPNIIKKETTIRTYNYSSNPPGTNLPYPDNFDQKQPPPQSTTVHSYTYDHQNHPDDKPLAYQVSPPRDNPPNVITYKYTTHQTTHNKYPGHPPDVMQPLLPRPFPTDDGTDGNPPKALDDLMASFTDTGITTREEHIQKQEPPVKKSSNARDGNAAILPVTVAPVTPAPQPKVLSKNVEGPPVYYPPGVEMFAKKEDAGSMQKASTKANKYEAANEKASKGGSGGAGAAIVPIPLCCGMACTIL